VLFQPLSFPRIRVTDGTIAIAYAKNRLIGDCSAGQGIANQSYQLAVSIDGGMTWTIRDVGARAGEPDCVGDTAKALNSARPALAIDTLAHAFLVAVPASTSIDGGIDNASVIQVWGIDQRFQTGDPWNLLFQTTLPAGVHWQFFPVLAVAEDFAHSTSNVALSYYQTDAETNDRVSQVVTGVSSGLAGPWTVPLDLTPTPSPLVTLDGQPKDAQGEYLGDYNAIAAVPPALAQPDAFPAQFYVFWSPAAIYSAGYNVPRP
jgi:hypothetical protein